MSRLRKVTYRCLNEDCGHQFEHRQGAHRPGDPGGPPDGCPACGHAYLTWLDWYVVMTNAKAEPAVNDKLKAMGFATLFLHYRRTIRHARKVEEVVRPYFPRYLFVGAAPGQGLYHVNNAPGVSTVLTSDGEPLRLDECEIDRLRAVAGDEGLIEVVQAGNPKRKRLLAGEICRIVQGPFTGLQGIVEVDKGREIALKLMLFGREITASMFPEALAPDRAARS